MIERSIEYVAWSPARGHPSDIWVRISFFSPDWVGGGTGPRGAHEVVAVTIHRIRISDNEMNRRWMHPRWEIDSWLSTILAGPLGLFTVLTRLVCLGSWFTRFNSQMLLVHLGVLRMGAPATFRFGEFEWPALLRRARLR